MKKRLITLALGAGATAVMGLGIMSPSAHAACTYAGLPNGGDRPEPTGTVYAGGSVLSGGYIGVGNLHGYLQASGNASGPSGSVGGALDGTNGIPPGLVCAP